MVMFGRMKIAETAYMAKCENCKASYGFLTPAERDSYLAGWHAGHEVSRSAETLTVSAIAR